MRDTAGYRGIPGDRVKTRTETVEVSAACFFSTGECSFLQPARPTGHGPDGVRLAGTLPVAPGRVSQRSKTHHHVTIVSPPCHHRVIACRHVTTLSSPPSGPHRSRLCTMAPAVTAWEQHGNSINRSVITSEKQHHQHNRTPVPARANTPQSRRNTAIAAQSPPRCAEAAEYSYCRSALRRDPNSTARRCLCLCTAA